MSNNAIGAMGAMATPFITGRGEFVGPNYVANPNTPAAAAHNANSSMGFDTTMNTQHALNGALAMGGGVLGPGGGMMAGILPAALKIQEHKDMQKVAERYYEKYIKDFNKKYGFTAPQIDELVTEFREVTDEIKKLIPDTKMQEMYEKYIESYPTMYLSMIPAEALQTKLAVKCVTDNKALRTKIESMSTCVSSLVKNLTDLQISAGIPPIVNLMFESMPDPLTAMTDPMYHKYNDAIVTYHKLLGDNNHQPAITRVDKNANVTNLDGTPGGLDNATLLRIEPVQYLKEQLRLAETTGDTVLTLSSLEDVQITAIDELKTIMENMQTQSGCQPFGEEWNHTGPTPPMNPAMCLGEEHRFQAGNPRHNVGRTNLYQAKRDQNGNAHWVQTGQVPALSNGGGPQMVQHQPQPMQQPDPWAGQNHMPGVDPRPIQQTGYHRPVQAVQFNEPFVGSGGIPGPGPNTRKPTTRKSKGARGAKGSKGSKGSKGAKGSKNRVV
ncbi:unnamed protein product [Ectocarpus sp. 8 AP-2014]